MPPLTDRRIDDLYRVALEERADALFPLTLTADEMTTRLERSIAGRRTRSQAALALLAAALLVGLALAALAVGGGRIRLAILPVATPSASPSLDVPAQTPSVTATPSTAGVTVSAWREVDPNPLARITDVYASAWSGSQFIIAGHPLTSPPRHTNDVAFLASPDGRTWSMSPVASTGYPQAFAFDGRAGVAVGSDGDQAAVWTSPDGRTWTRLPNPPALTLSGSEVGLQLDAIARGPAGYVALAQLGVAPNPTETVGRALVLWSPDGRDWQRVPMDLFGNTELTDLAAVAVVNGRYVIAGTIYAPGSATASSSATPTLWTSVDGRDWRVEPALEDSPAAFTNLVSGPAGALLTGVERLGTGLGDACGAWRSGDGLLWTRTAHACPQLLVHPGLVAAPFGFVASTPMPLLAPIFGNGPVESPSQTPAPTLAPSACAGGVQVSATGDQWTCVPPPPVGPIAPGDSVQASEHELLWIGESRTPSNEIALSAWTADVRTGD